MPVKSYNEIARKKLSEEQIQANRDWARQEILEMNLKELRCAFGKTQAEVSSLADMNQADLSKMERREDHLLSTLRRYVEALGGEIEITAKFHDKKVKLVGV